MSEATDPPPPTAPQSFQITVRAFGPEAEARTLGETVGTFVRELSRYLDLSALDGVTVAGDYPQALAELDRGYVTSYRLSPSEGAAVGIAMTPSVLRGEQLKSHIVLHAGAVSGLCDMEGGDFAWALHTLAHEAAHVAVTAAFDRCFPNTLLREASPDVQHAFRWQIILACWDEYAATLLSAPFGEAPTDGYETTFLKVLESTRPTAYDAIRAYRVHGDVDQVLAQVYGICGDLLKFGAYLLGDLDGRGVDVTARTSIADALRNH